MVKLFVLIAALFVVGLGGVLYIANQEPQTVVLTGTVRYNERIALPPGSLLTVELREVTDTGSPVATVSRYEYTTGGENVPLPYTLTFTADVIDRKKQYVLFSEIVLDSIVRFTTEESYPVSGIGDNPSGIDILLVSATAAGESTLPSPSDPDEPSHGSELTGSTQNALAGTSWQWRETTTADGVIVPEGDAFVLSFTADGVRSTTDCNGLSGQYVAVNGNITFSSFMMTEMYCAGSQEGVYASALAKALQFRIEGTALTLDIGDGHQMRFMRTEVPAVAPAPSLDPDATVSSDAVMPLDPPGETEVSIDPPAQ